jgi:hypothetical protein
MGLRVPVPPTELEVNRILEKVGKPDGLVFPYASRMVKVKFETPSAAIDVDEATRVLVARE